MRAPDARPFRSVARQPVAPRACGFRSPALSASCPWLASHRLASRPLCRGSPSPHQRDGHWRAHGKQHHNERGRRSSRVRLLVSSLLRSCLCAALARLQKLGVSAARDADAIRAEMHDLDAAGHGQSFVPSARKSHGARPTASGSKPDRAGRQELERRAAIVRARHGSGGGGNESGLATAGGSLATCGLAHLEPRQSASSGGRPGRLRPHRKFGCAISAGGVIIGARAAGVTPIPRNLRSIGPGAVRFVLGMVPRSAGEVATGDPKNKPAGAGVKCPTRTRRVILRFREPSARRRQRHDFALAALCQRAHAIAP